MVISRWVPAGSKALPMLAMPQRTGSLLFQPQFFLFSGHAAFFEGFGKTLFFGALLLAASGTTVLPAINGHLWLAVVQYEAELFGADLKETGKAFKLALAQADQFNRALLKFFPDIGTEAKTASGSDQRHTTTGAQFGEIRRYQLVIEDAA